MENISGPWGADQVRHYLTTATIPIRIATVGASGPLVQSLWFWFDADVIWCCTQQEALLVRRIRKDPRVGFEVSSDAPPYRGVRGRATAAIEQAEAATVLPRLIERYQAPDGLADWLLSRTATEVAICLGNIALTSWDFTRRMTRGEPETQP